MPKTRSFFTPEMAQKLGEIRWIESDEFAERRLL